MKICTKCKVEKALECFYANPLFKDGLSSSCKTCQSLSKKLHYKANKKRILARNKTWHEANKEKAADHSKAWYEANKEKVSAHDKAYYQANKKRILARNKAYREANKDKINAKYYEKLKTNPKFKLAQTLRGRIKQALKAQGTRKSQSTLELLGSSVAFARKWIESQFLPGMTWENHGEWHIDHIKPCAAFDLRDPNQQRECFKYTNLQPLWAFDNISKGDRF